MLTGTVLSSRPAGSLLVRANGAQIPSRAGAVLMRSLDQRRGFRHGFWSSYLDAEFMQEMRRRQRSIRHKQLEALSRRLAWEKHPEAESVCKIGKRMASHYQRAKQPRSWLDAGSTGGRPGNNIEDVERGALEYLLFGHSAANKASAVWPSGSKSTASPSGSVARKSQRHSRGPSSTGASTSVFQEAPHGNPLQSSVEPDYMIDPITNRKVPKPPVHDPWDGPQPTKAYQPHFAGLEAPGTPDSATSFPSLGPVFDADLPATSEELKRYGRVEIDKLRLNGSGVVQSASPLNQPPVLESEDYVKKPSPQSSGSQQPLHTNCDGVFWHWVHGVEMTGGENLAKPTKTGKRTQEDGLSATSATEPDAPADKSQSVEAEASEFKSPNPLYEDLDKYKPVMEKRTPVPQAPSTEYEDLSKYNPVMEKDSSAPPELSAAYDDLDKYKPVMEKRTPLPEDPLSEYRDLDEYTPVKHNEPDGKPRDFVPSEAYTDLPKYKAFRHNEPDGRPLGYEKPSYDKAELDQYRAFMYNEPDGKPSVGSEPRTSAESAIPSGKAVTCTEPEGYKDLDMYCPFWYNEPDGKPPAQVHLATHVEDYRKYDTVRYHEPHGMPPSEPKPYSDLASYGAVKHNEPDGKAPEPADTVAESLESFDMTQRLQGLDLNTEPRNEGKSEDLDGLRASDVRASAAARAAALSGTTESPGVKHSSTASPSQSSSADHAREFLENSRQPFDLEGGNDDAQSTATSKAPKAASSTPTSLSRSRLTGPERIQAILDPYCKTAQGLETSYVEECAGVPTWPTYVRTYGSVASSLRADSNDASLDMSIASPAMAVQPMVYKILAYDPTMQKVNIAETTSTVPDSSTALPPAEALLRLSQPTKFFPHFAPLQAEGFEIVSGSGDVLVFRKAREATPAKDCQTQSSRASDQPAPAAVNPIDMTGAQARVWQPASANFASPTGYVMYDPEPLDDSRPPPPGLRSDGKSDRQRDGVDNDTSASASSQTGTAGSSKVRRRPARLAKRMIVGATWVAGVSYGLGVVVEYFKSGGSDGKGPTGF